jgi:hypothetical protein
MFMFGWFLKSDPLLHWPRDNGLSAWFAFARQNAPRGLNWIRYEATAEATVLPPWAVVPVQLQGEPTPDGPLADVPASREPRQVVAVFHWNSKSWQVVRTVMNLSAADVLNKLLATMK